MMYAHHQDARAKAERCKVTALEAGLLLHLALYLSFSLLHISRGWDRLWPLTRQRTLRIRR